MGIFTNKKNRKASKIKIKKTLKRNKSGARKMRGGVNPVEAALVAKLSAAASSGPGAQSAPSAQAFDPIKVAEAIRAKKNPELAIQETIKKGKIEGLISQNTQVKITPQMIADAIKRAKVVTEDAKKINPEAYQVMKRDIHSTMFFERKNRGYVAENQVKQAQVAQSQKTRTGRFNGVPLVKMGMSKTKSGKHS